MDYKNHKIVIIGAGELQIPLIKAAKKLGLFVIATDQDPQALGFKDADDCILANTMDPQESLAKIQQYVEQKGPIHAVVTSGTDASLTVATIADFYHLPGHSVVAAHNASDKALMRKAFEKAETPIPQYKIISSIEEAKGFFEKIQSPCVIKPTNNMGARGITLISQIQDIPQAYALAYDHNRGHQELLIEEYINAHELSIDALVFDDKIMIAGIADRIIEYPPYFVETGHILPSNLPQSWLDRAISTFQQGIRALGLSHGAAKADLKISEHHTWVIEIAARLSGGFMSSHTFPFATGIPLHEHMVLLALGKTPPPLTPTHDLVSIERAIICPPGEIISIKTDDDLQNLKYFSHLSLRAKIGDTVRAPKNNLDKQGCIIATAPTRELALRTINQALEKIHITVQPEHNPNTIPESQSKAKELLKGVCNVCKECNGVWCRGQIPGVGGVGTGEGFIQSYERYRTLKIIPHYIHDVRTVDTSCTMFGKTFSMPVFIAPMGGAKINFNNALSELDLQRNLLKGAMQAGTMTFAPDPAQYELFFDVSRAILENFGHSIIICKPRKDDERIKIRFQSAIEAGVLGLGTDIDGIGLKTFSDTKESIGPKNVSELKTLISAYKDFPFVIKGILSPADALKAVEAGATHIIVSSHGGRIGEAFPHPIDMLPKIKETLGDRIPILIDGSIRSGSDVIKALLLGADAVLIGRPAAIHAIGGGHQAVTAYLNSIQQQISTQMLLLGVSSLQELKSHPELLLKIL